MMRTWPSDGWDGAAEVIAAHARKVVALEEELDREQPDWRNSPEVQYTPRTPDPRE